MSARKPYPICARVASDEAGGRVAAVPGYVDMHIVYEGLKGNPVDTARISKAHALQLAEELIHAARKA